MSAARSSPRRIVWIPDDGYVKDEGWRVSIVVEGEAGHHPTGDWPYDGQVGQRCPWFWGHDYDKALELAYKRNEQLGVSREETDAIVQGSVAKSSPTDRIGSVMRVDDLDRPIKIF